MDKKRPYTFLFRKGADQTVASPGAKPVAKSGKRGPAKKAAMRSIGLESKAKPAAGTTSAVAVAKRIGVLDIDVYAGFLFRVLTAINKRQKMFEFHQIEATTPVGLTRSGERMRKIVQEKGGNSADPTIMQNAYAPDIFAFAKPVSELRGIDVLVCLIAPMIMDELTVAEDGQDGIAWNYFGTNEGKTIIVSAYGVRDYAEKSGRTFESALAILIAGQLICDYTKTVASQPLRYHDETRGCVLDYCGNRADLMKVIAKPALCAECLAKVHPNARKGVLSMIKAIAEYQR